MVRRNLEPALRDAMSDAPVMLLHRDRQTTKSTCAKSALPGARYLTLDDATILAAAAGDPSGFIAGLDGPTIIDEVQHAPGLFRAIKASVDRDRRPGRF